MCIYVLHAIISASTHTASMHICRPRSIHVSPRCHCMAAMRVGNPNPVGSDDAEEFVGAFDGVLQDLEEGHIIS